MNILVMHRVHWAEENGSLKFWMGSNSLSASAMSSRVKETSSKIVSFSGCEFVDVCSLRIVENLNSLILKELCFLWGFIAESASLILYWSNRRFWLSKFPCKAVQELRVSLYGVYSFHFLLIHLIYNKFFYVEVVTLKLLTCCSKRLDFLSWQIFSFSALLHVNIDL